jgi:hypothetical protein
MYQADFLSGLTNTQVILLGVLVRVADMKVDDIKLFSTQMGKFVGQNASKELQFN